MPLSGFRCPDWVPTAGNKNKIEWCLGECPHQCIAPPLLAAMWESEKYNHHTGTYISSSMLAGSVCARQTVWERKYGFYEIPVRRFWAFRGTHAHSIVEKAAPVIGALGWIQELRMAVDFVYPDLPQPIIKNDKFTGKFNKQKPLIITVGGTCDAFNPMGRELWDMKSMKEAKAEYMITGQKPKWFKDAKNAYDPHLEDSWVRQLNIYRLLLARTKVSDYIKKELNIDCEYYPAPEKLGIQAIGMMQVPRTGAPYTIKHQVGRQWVEETFEIPSIPVWPLAETEEFVRKEALKWFKWLVLEEPTPLVDADKTWVCKTCPFNGEIFSEGQCFPTAERNQLEIID